MSGLLVRRKLHGKLSLRYQPVLILFFLLFQCLTLKAQTSILTFLDEQTLTLDAEMQNIVHEVEINPQKYDSYKA